MISFDTNLLLYSLNQDRREVMDEVWRWAGQLNAGRRVVFDARLALTLRHHGVNEFATRNDSHFTGFGFSRVWSPLPGGLA